ncbi:MAG TPA: LysR substrate-binding domain-containing protein [Hyphomicrobiales bacterium]|nr:LysR substrate-binding domain-containing protein [Hyphomicrobiales bacterium]
MRFTLRQLEYFVATGEVGSLTLAAERINISPPSISAAIAHLEAELGIQLFIRHHARGLSLTPVGEEFLRNAKALLHHADELQAIASEMSGEVAGTIAIGCLVTLYPHVIPALVHAFHARYPRARVRVTAADQEALFVRLRRGEIALAITYDLDIPGDIGLDPLARLPPYAFFAADHRLAARRSITLQELADEPLILLDLPLSRDYFMSLFFHSGLRPRVEAEFEQLEVIRSLVARGGCYGLANVRPKNHASLDGRLLSYVSLEGDHRALSAGLATLKGYRQTRTALAFQELCCELVQGGSLPGAD